ncbi:hypothetical protein MHM88_07955, partial [Epibacterium sp. MM17-32]|uniref:hypothetical protein n=1 Tax=Epibacterium sp. MM17-32 TaxID=2917734 RepID=UPI001EF73F39
PAPQNLKPTSPSHPNPKPKPLIHNQTKLTHRLGPGIDAASAVSAVSKRHTHQIWRASGIQSGSRFTTGKRNGATPQSGAPKKNARGAVAPRALSSCCKVGGVYSAAI